MIAAFTAAVTALTIALGMAGVFVGGPAAGIAFLADIPRVLAALLFGLFI